MKFDFLQQVGTNNIGTARKCPYLYNLNCYLPDPVQEFTIHITLENISMYVQQLCNFTWFVKDNSVNLNTAYLYDSYNQKVFSKVRMIHFSTSAGKYDDTEFEISELLKAKQLLEKYVSIISRKRDDAVTDFEWRGTGVAQESEFNASDYNSNNLIDRAINFLTQARSNSFLPYKIAMYMPIYECLFSYENTEISSKIALRASRYIGTSKDERREINKSISDAYNVCTG